MPQSHDFCRKNLTTFLDLKTATRQIHDVPTKTILGGIHHEKYTDN
jgi:hypothetical protein